MVSQLCGRYIDSGTYTFDDDSTQAVGDKEDRSRHCLPELALVFQTWFPVSSTFESFLSKHKSDTSDLA